MILTYLLLSPVALRHALLIVVDHKEQAELRYS
jgi:hypothetical protein